MADLDAQRRAYMRSMSRHFVVLSFLIQRFKDGKPTMIDAFDLSGWIISLHDQVFWVTAAHSLKLIDKEITNGNMEVKEAGFMDCFGAEAKDSHPIPFHYEVGCGMYLPGDEPGLDVAVIQMDYLTIRNFIVNGIKSVGRSNWIQQDNISFEHYNMLGIPHHLAHFSVTKGGQVSTAIRPVLIAIDAVDRTTIPNPPPEDWFVGRITPEADISSIEGMSGGPIYGFRRDGDKWLYHVVALQSRWREEERIIMGCPVKRFAELMHITLGEALRAIEAGEEDEE